MSYQVEPPLIGKEPVDTALKYIKAPEGIAADAGCELKKAKGSIKSIVKKTSVLCENTRTISLWYFNLIQTK